MLKTDSAVAAFHTHEQAEKAILGLQSAGVSLKSLSIAAKDTHTEEHAVGYYNTGHRMQYWGNIGAYFGFICDSWMRTNSCRRTSRRMDRSGSGGSSCRWRCECFGCRTGERRYSEEQCDRIRNCAQNGQVSAHRPRDAGRGFKGSRSTW